MAKTKEDEGLYAKLVRGRHFVYGGITFGVGEWHPVTQAQREHLEEHAVDLVTVSGGGEVNHGEEKQKFAFHVGVPEDLAVKSSRSRKLADDKPSARIRTR